MRIILHLGHLEDAFIHHHSERLIHTDGGVNRARQQPAGQEQLGVSVLLGVTSTLGGAGD